MRTHLRDEVAGKPGDQQRNSFTEKVVAPWVAEIHNWTAKTTLQMR